MSTTAPARNSSARVQRNVLIALSDGTELAGDLYLPEGDGPWPALLSYYPYHKDDVIGGACEYARRFFTARGYASLLVDFRGTGSSGGVFTENFDTVQEARDGAEAVEWAAAQEWCSGSVGAYGISYGGIMALAIASLRPPHLKAIAPMYGPSDVRSEWIAPGDCPNCLGNYAREAFMLAMDLAPPMHQDEEGRWRDVWEERLSRLRDGEPYTFRWLEHATYDEYWRSRAIPLEEIEVPSFFIGGWRDLFPEAVPGSFTRVSAPKRLLMGPWLHVPPDFSSYEPVEWLDQVGAWWDRWLLEEQNGVEDEPPVTLFVQGSGQWRYEREWPPARNGLVILHPGAGVLSFEAAAPSEDVYVADPTVGSAAGLWDPLGVGIGYPLEQSGDDLRSLAYTSAPLEHDTEITGSPVAYVELELDAGSELQLVAKLSAVAPSGAATLITTGWHDAAHREGRERTLSLSTATRYRLSVRLWATSYRVTKGNRLRLSLSCADFPRVWPSRTNPTIRVFTGGEAETRLELPVTPEGGAGPVTLPPFERAAIRTPWNTAATPIWTVGRDLVDDAVQVELGVSAEMELPSGVALTFGHHSTAAVGRQRPAEARIASRAEMNARLPTGERVEVETRGAFTRDTIALEGRITLDGTVIFDRKWSS